ncbi:MAG: putative signal transduction protein [Ilumatobacteraceae bacterium]|nr:putative signal transduction protein [Ilumatobacteraceae bacterium]
MRFRSAQRGIADPAPAVVSTTAQADTPSAWAESIVYISRQPIFDQSRRAVAYDLRHLETEQPATPGEATRELVQGAMLHWGLDELIGGRVGHVRVDPTFLAAGLQATLPAERIVLDLHDDVDADEASRSLAVQAQRAGFRLAIGDVTRRVDPVSPQMLMLADIINVDITSLHPDELDATLRTLRVQAPQASVLAYNVDELCDYSMCSTIGFDMFQGQFFAKPDVLTKSARPVDSIAAIALLVELQRPDLDIHRLETLIMGDPTLTYRLLTLVNSGLIGLATAVESVYHAIVMLGIDRVRQLATLVTMSSRSKNTEELVLLAATRSGMARRLIERSDLEQSASTVGLLSVLDVIFRVPMEEVVADLPLTPAVSEALTKGTGVLGTLMTSIYAYERVDLKAFEKLGPGQLARYIGIFREAASEAERLRVQLTLTA